MASPLDSRNRIETAKNLGSPAWPGFQELVPPVQTFLAELVVHYLPAYAPQTNPIEGVWWRLHEEVTRNHRCGDMAELLGLVRAWLAADHTFPIESDVYEDLRMAA